LFGAVKAVEVVVVVINPPITIQQHQTFWSITRTLDKLNKNKVQYWTPMSSIFLLEGKTCTSRARV